MSEFHDLKKESYRAQQAAGRGAGVTLVSKPGEYVATFDCAKRCSTILGTCALDDMGGGIPRFRIPLEEMHDTCQKLASRFSVSLVDYVIDRHRGRFVLVWRIDRRGALKVDLSDY